jgi:hypothetical protein
LEDERHNVRQESIWRQTGGHFLKQGKADFGGVKNCSGKGNDQNEYKKENRHGKGI